MGNVSREKKQACSVCHALIHVLQAECTCSMDVAEACMQFELGVFQFVQVMQGPMRTSAAVT